jgi:regulator of cell morphogenesis and NO signaling
MHTVDPSSTLAALVTANPRLAAPLERLGLDYCCGGQQLLGDAADELGLDVDAVVAELEAVEAPAAPEPWASMGPAELVDHLEATHHAYLREALPRLEALAVKVETVHGERHAELHEVRRLTMALRADLEPHLLKEERILFPMIRELAASSASPTFHCGTLANPIRVLLLEHDQVGVLLAETRATTGGFEVPADGCASYQALYDGLAELEQDTHLHVHKENNVLFPAVLALESSMAASG